MNTLPLFCLLSICLFGASLGSLAQSPSSTTGNWLMFFNQTQLLKKWSIHSEVQYRSFEITPNTEQLLLRGGINYHISNSAFASGGYAYIANLAFDKDDLNGVQVSENRTWQQFILRQNIGRVLFENRYRLEQRWLQSNDNNLYLNRTRVLLRLTILLNKKQLEKHTVFLTFYDELFIHLSSMPFDRNRLYGALGYQFLPNLNIQLGYLAQTTNISTNEYLQTAIF